MLCVMVIQQYVTVMKDLILPDVINVLLVTMAFLNVLNQVLICQNSESVQFFTNGELIEILYILS